MLRDSVKYAFKHNSKVFTTFSLFFFFFIILVSPLYIMCNTISEIKSSFKPTIFLNGLIYHQNILLCPIAAKYFSLLQVQKFGKNKNCKAD